ncbi:uncharacterized protein CLAFUR5_11436 [Fulvia fulva]|uniref:DUF7730 domain-containing protein n=1 Tax=Passalora fulva TaxID=5499 RepID=A0A9Q8PE08_PASFU|nr:uncharacterized protein CLAFUR5_11436 [Fulvia fulva]KAK4619077.1 hypothetical protein CLAFUR0_12424 [Fulvia fulva]UJO20748.1 hypothetical protein CLAFUR5_11436 [Fulvia fulva]
MNTTLPFFRLPQELREQIYSYLFDKDEPYIQSLPRMGCTPDELVPPPHYTGCLRVWIENEDLVTNPTYQNRRLAEPMHDRAAILRTCRKIYGDASEYLYGKTQFMIFNGQKYRKHFKGSAGASSWDEENTRVASLLSREVKREFPYDKHPWSPCPGAAFWGFGQVPESMWTAPRCELMGTIPSCEFLRRAQHVRISIWAKKPQNLGKMIAMLQKLFAVFPSTMRTVNVRLQFNEPRRQSIRPFLDEEEFNQLVALLTTFKSVYPTAFDARIMADSAWWIAAFRKEKLLALEELCGPGSVYPNPRFYNTFYDKHLVRWRIAYCDVLECESCMNCRLAAAWFGETK